MSIKKSLFKGITYTPDLVINIDEIPEQDEGPNAEFSLCEDTGLYACKIMFQKNENARTIFTIVKQLPEYPDSDAVRMPDGSLSNEAYTCSMCAEFMYEGLPTGKSHSLTSGDFAMFNGRDFTRNAFLGLANLYMMQLAGVNV